MSVVGGFLAGGAIGLHHALEADHLAAVATLVGDESTAGSAAVGASWGVGHAVPIVFLGTGFLVLGVTVPPWVTGAVEGLVGLVLVGLGLRMLAVAARVVDLATHAHESGGRHRHLVVGNRSLGLTHGHVHGEAALVGVLHGVAGSGVLVVALVASSPTLGDALSVLGGFVALSIPTMAVLSLVWGRSLATGLRRPLQVGAGVVGVVVGLALLAEVAGLGLA